MTLVELQAQRESIIKEMSLAQQTAVEGRSITRRSIADLEKALGIIDGEIAAASTPSGKQARIHRIVCG
jgi:hypothetical protein